MTDIVESLEHLARLKSLSGQAGHARMAMNFAVAEIKQLRAAISKIDCINDNPSHYNPDINAICDTILRPHLVVGQSQKSES